VVLRDNRDMIAAILRKTQGQWPDYCYSGRISSAVLSADGLYNGVCAILAQPGLATSDTV
jgi:hypothetical protein